MKILIANDGMHAHYHERLAWVNAFNSIPGINASMYDVHRSVAFDVFDVFNPDVYIGQLYNLSPATIKCIKERPHLKVILRAGEYNDEEKNERILHSTEEERNKLKEIYVSFLYSHYNQNDIEKTHINFIKEGYKVVGIPMSADLHTYGNAVHQSELECDIGFVGGYWPYKGQVIDKYLTPLCHNSNLHIKIFGNQPWPHVNQYCGLLNDSDVANLFKSAKICPNLSEPHAHTKGIDVNERCFKVLAAGGFVISDNVRALREMIPSLPIAQNPKVFKYLIEIFLKDEKKREKVAKNCRNEVLNSHTNFHRIETMLKELDEDIYLNKVREIMNAFINNIQQR